MVTYLSSLGPAAGKAKVVIVAKEGDPTLEELAALPEDAEVVFRGLTIEDFSDEEVKGVLSKANIVLFCQGNKELMKHLCELMPGLAWVHSRSAGVDHLLSPEFIESKACLTNARGLFSSSLAEYVVLACLYFAKDVDRWKRQQRERKWEKYEVTEIKGKTLGVIGYGDIGQAAARNAKALGMRVIGQRRRPELSRDDGIADEMMGDGQVGDVIAKSDYIVVAAALTSASVGLVGAKELARAQPHAVIISIGRGPLIDEDAMIAMLQDGRLRGAALDVFCKEPLPTESPLWGMENVLLSPHNADLTATFLNDSVRQFVMSVKGFMVGEEVPLHRVDKKAGY